MATITKKGSVVSIELKTKYEKEVISAVLHLGTEELKKHEEKAGAGERNVWADKFHKAYEKIVRKG